MQKTAIWILLLAGMTGLIRGAEDTATRFRNMLDRYYGDYLAVYPIDAAINGDNDSRFENIWPNNISADQRTKVIALADTYLGELKQFDRSALSSTDRLSYDTLQWLLAIRRDGTKQLFSLLPINQFSSPLQTFAQLASGENVHPFHTAQDYRNFISRARGFSEWIDTAIANMREGIRTGVVLPRVLIERIPPQLESLMSDDPSKNILFGPLQKLATTVSLADQAQLRTEYTAAIREIMIPAYRRMDDFIKQEYLPHGRSTAGIGALPGGKEAYAYAVRLQTTTDLSPEEVHAIGLREVARIRTEMEKVRVQVGFKGTLPAFLVYVASDPKFFFYKSDEAILDGFRAVEARVMAEVPKYFGHLPRTKFEIRATEKFRAAAAAHEYNPGTMDGSRPGIFSVPIPDVTKYWTPRMEDLFLHEAIPGHHFQLSLALENTALPKFRRYDGNNAYAEGWGLYSESLGRELGLYTDPFQYFGMLLGDMHRAVRLVVDTGLHSKGWTREQALAYTAENEGGTIQQNQVEIERYMAWPGQALGYKIGQLKIRELRTLAEQALGPKFDLRAFHDVILMEGALPLAVLEAHVRSWISEVQGK